MGWMDYYRLLEKYDGNFKKASRQEKREAARANPNDPFSARMLATQKYREAQKEAEALANDAKREMFGDEADLLPDDMGCK